jgi:hypothetical protein
LLSPITAAADRSESTTLLVSEGSGLPRALQPAFDDGARPPPLALLAQVLESIAGQEIPVSNLSDPTSETALVYLLAIIDDGSAREELPQIPNSWHTSLRRTAATALDTLRHRVAGPLPSITAATAHPVATDRLDPRRNPLDQQRWAFDGSQCAGISAERVTNHVWLEAVLEELKGSRIQDPVLQGQFMRQMICGPLHFRLLQQIQELPDVRAAVNAGSATFEHYAAAIIATTDPSAILQSHYEASRPKRRSGERLVDAVLRTELAFRTAAAHGCQPAAAGRFWAVFGLLTPTEQSSYTGRPGVLARLRRPLHESEAAASTRFGDLVTDLVTWAKAQYTTAPAGQQQRTPRHEAALTPQAAGSAPHHRRSATPRGRRPAAAHAAAAVAPVAGPADPLAPSSSSDEEDNGFPAHAAAAGGATSPRTPTRVYWYKGNKEDDAVETARRRANGLCLQCHPSGPINAWPCPVHANRGQRPGPNVLRCITYPS